MRGEETNKVRKNIPECLAGNRTAVGIRMRSVPRNKEEEAKLKRFFFGSSLKKEVRQPRRKRENV